MYKIFVIYDNSRDMSFWDEFNTFEKAQECIKRIKEDECMKNFTYIIKEVNI